MDPMGEIPTSDCFRMISIPWGKGNQIQSGGTTLRGREHAGRKSLKFWSLFWKERGGSERDPLSCYRGKRARRSRGRGLGDRGPALPGSEGSTLPKKSSEKRGRVVENLLQGAEYSNFHSGGGGHSLGINRIFLGKIGSKGGTDIGTTSLLFREEGALPEKKARFFFIR